jgi:type III secretion system-like peptide-binding chaperone
MSELMWIRSHVERLLQDEWRACRVVADDEGDYPFRDGTAACWVSVLDTPPVMVRVFAHAACGLRPSLELLTELNEIQLRALSVAVMLHDDVVIVQQTISPLDLSGPVLAQTLRAVGGVADDIGILLASMFNGVTPYPSIEASTSEDAA